MSAGLCCSLAARQSGSAGREFEPAGSQTDSQAVLVGPVLHGVQPLESHSSKEIEDKTAIFFCFF